VPQSSSDALAGLHDVVTPPAVSYAPQTVGWVIFAGTLALVLGWLGWRAWRLARANRYRKVAVTEIDRIAATLADPAAGSAALAEINEVLKRTALTAWPRSQVASLAGEGWLAFLDETGGGEAFRRGAGKALADRVYVAGDGGGEVSAVLGPVRHWIRHHRVDSVPRPEVRETGGRISGPESQP
jgi:hypothetical protein